MDGRIDWEGLIVRPFLFPTRIAIWAKEHVFKTRTLGDELMARLRKLDNMTSSVDEGPNGYDTDVGHAGQQCSTGESGGCHARTLEAALYGTTFRES